MSHPSGHCPICEKPFQNRDDVVTCPSCGAPYHRACYEKEGHCLFADKHGQGFEYAAPADAASDSAQDTASAASGNADTSQQRVGGTLCPFCGTLNDEQHIFCENCGRPLHASAPFGAAPGAGGFGADGGAAIVDGSIDGIPKKEWSLFIGRSAPTYLFRLSQMEKSGKKISFMASAFFFTPAYFAYRKMWGWAALSLLATILFIVPQIVLFSAEIGQPLFPALSFEAMDIVSLVVSFVSIVMRILFGLYAMYLYRQNGGRQIHAMQDQYHSGPTYEEALRRKGGTSILGVVLVCALLTLFYLLCYYLIGDMFYYYFYPLAG